MDKRCFTLISCPFEKSCALAHTPHSQVQLWFQPEHTGEHCHHYIAMQETHDEIMAKMGVLS